MTKFTYTEEKKIIPTSKCRYIKTEKKQKGINNLKIFKKFTIT